MHFNLLLSDQGTIRHGPHFYSAGVLSGNSQGYGLKAVACEQRAREASESYGIEPTSREKMMRSSFVVGMFATALMTGSTVSVQAAPVAPPVRSALRPIV